MSDQSGGRFHKLMWCFDGVSQRTNEFLDPLREVRVSSVFADFSDDGAAHDDAICETRDIRGLLRRGNAEADGNGEGGVPANFRDARFDGVGERGLLAGDAFARDIVDESLGGGAKARHALGRRGWRNQPDGFQPVRGGKFRALLGLVGRGSLRFSLRGGDRSRGDCRKDLRKTRRSIPGPRRSPGLRWLSRQFAGGAASWRRHLRL